MVINGKHRSVSLFIKAGGYLMARKIGLISFMGLLLAGASATGVATPVLWGMAGLIVFAIFVVTTGDQTEQ
jgi:hypothetical protein